MRQALGAVSKSCSSVTCMCGAGLAPETASDISTSGRLRSATQPMQDSLRHLHVWTSQKGDSADAAEVLEAQCEEGGRFHCSWLPALRLLTSMTSVMHLATESKRTRWSSCLWWPVTVAGLSK